MPGAGDSPGGSRFCHPSQRAPAAGWQHTTPQHRHPTTAAAPGAEHPQAEQGREQTEEP